MIMNTDPEAIAREILRLDADRSAAEPQGDFLDYMVALRKTAPTLAAAYLDLRATSTEALEAERIRCTRQAERDAARRDAAYLDLRAHLDAAQTRIVALEAEKHRMYDEHSRLVRVANEEAHTNAAWWRSQLDAVTAQRDELREAATDFVSRVSNVVPVDSFGHRKTSLQRLRAALEAAR